MLSCVASELVSDVALVLCAYLSVAGKLHTLQGGEAADKERAAWVFHPGP